VGRLRQRRGAAARRSRLSAGRRSAHGYRLANRRLVHNVIYDELCVGIVDDGSREQYRRIMGELVDQGAEGILLGCTEIDLLVGSQDARVPVFDTTHLHVQKAIELAFT